MGLMSGLAKLAVVALLVVLGACSSAPREPSVPVETPPDYTEVDPPFVHPEPAPRPAPAPTTGPAAANQQLLVQSAEARSRGDYEQSLALLERAQRIDPRSGRVYLELAATHNARGDERQARIVAERGLLYCVERSVCEGLRSFAY